MIDLAKCDDLDAYERAMAHEAAESRYFATRSPGSYPDAVDACHRVLDSGFEACRYAIRVVELQR
ncbi:MAG: hypothetical protein JNM17_09225 [Archangium sp.]|nr:hypothetical protein [Archangium sp.]